MKNYRIKNQVLFCILVAALMMIAMPAGAVNGSISIAYRGSGGYYIGDTIIFDGQNSFGNVTLIRISGPDLPPGGVPIYDLNGDAGTGSVIPGETAGSWKFAWYTSTIQGIEKLQTARYTLTVFDKTIPDKTATTSILLKKPEFYVVAIPSVAGQGDYVQLTGSIEKGVTSAHFDITDESGNRVHSYDTSVSSSGYFNKGFHIDMPPGVYHITMSSPSVRTTYRSYLTVEPKKSPAGIPETTIPVSQAPEPDAARPVSPEDSFPSMATGGTGSLLVTSSPLGATLYLDSTIAGQTPLELAPVSSGSHLVEIKAPGYLAYSVQVQVDAGEAKEINAVLLKPSASTPVAPLTIVCGILVSFALVVLAIRRRTP
ncbi:MAG TPA: PEGA domain-containing protein [Methanoregula sp.]|nr:PEGA domain-containing protein [Methanoregula sp.]